MSEVRHEPASNQIERVERLPFVIEVKECSREDATHRVETRLGVIRMRAEVQQLEDAGVRVVAFSRTPPSGIRMYVDASP